MVDAMDCAIEHGRYAGGVRRNGRAQAFDHAPVDAVVLVAGEVDDRHLVRLGAGHVGRDGAHQVVPAATRLEQRGGGAVGLAFAGLIEPLVEGLLGGNERTLLIVRETVVEGEPHPRRRRTIDGAPLTLGDLGPWVALGGMQPAAAEIERKASVLGRRQGAAAEARTCFEDDAGDSGVVQSARRPDAGRPTADDGNLCIVEHGVPPTNTSYASTGCMLVLC